MNSNEQIVNSAYAAFAVGDIPTVIGLLADDVVWHTPKTVPQGGTYKGAGEVVQFFQAIGASWSSLTLDIESVASAGEALVVGILRATGALIDGAASSYGAVHVFSVQDGKIAAFREYLDLDAAVA